MLFSEYEYRAERLDAVHLVKDSVLSLPIYPELSDEEVGFIAQRIRQFSP
jgi:dTDP-4-amino-4,6-dideoxygalactose transaminase